MTAEKIYWITHEGGTLDLTDGVTYSVLKGLSGRVATDYEIEATKAYAYPGKVARMVSANEREIVLPVIVKGADSTAVRTAIRDLFYAMSPSRGEGWLRHVAEDTTVRLIHAYLSETLQDEPQDSKTDTWQKVVLTFTCNDPYFYDPVEHSQYITGYASWNFPFAFENEGDVDAYPIWCIGGPVTDFTLSNETTGKTIDATITLTTDRLYIDTRPLMHTVLLDHLTNKRSALSTDSKLFPLVPGINMISFIPGGAASTDTTIWGRWVHRYEGV